MKILKNLSALIFLVLHVSAYAAVDTGAGAPILNGLLA